MSHWDFGTSPAGRHDPDWRYLTGDDDGLGAEDDGTLAYPITWERDQAGADGYQHDQFGPVTGQAPPQAGDSSAGRHRGAGVPGRTRLTGLAGRPPGTGRAVRRRPARPRWLVPAAIAAAGTLAGITTVVLVSGGRPAAPAAVPGWPTAVAPAAPARPPASPAPPLSLAQAQGIVAAYTAANNAANARRSDALLAGVETGSSYAIDAGLYRVQLAAGAPPYPAFGPVRAAYYIPRAEQASGPRWFAVRVSNAFFNARSKVISTEYLLFTQQVGGGPWRNALEPYLVPGATAPQVAVGADGLATAVSTAPGSGGGTGSASLAVAPDQIAGVTAASLDGGPDGAGTVANPATAAASLADRLDERRWQSRLPTAAITDRHAAAPGGTVFGLLTTDGGALLFYADTARLTLAPPAGALLRLTVPGFYSPATPLAQAVLSYADQLAAYDPPARSGGAPRVVASYSGITGTS